MQTPTLNLRRVVELKKLADPSQLVGDKIPDGQRKAPLVF